MGESRKLAASELREEWDDFLAEAQTVKKSITRSSEDGERRAETSRKGNGTPGRPRGRASKARSRRPAG